MPRKVAVPRKGAASSKGMASREGSGPLRGSVANKATLQEELLAKVEADCAAMERAQADAVEAATHDEAKPENDKDTRALEASYLARGQAERLEALQQALAELRALRVEPWPKGEPIGLGALVSYSHDDVERTVWVLPQAGGIKLARGRVQVVTPQSPLGQALLGKRQGDEGEVAVAGERREFEVGRVR